MSHGISAGQSNQSPFPPPPGFALTYTTDNVKNQRTLKPPPVPKKFTVFGEEINMEGVSRCSFDVCLFVLEDDTVSARIGPPANVFVQCQLEIGAQEIEQECSCCVLGFARDPDQVVSFHLIRRWSLRFRCPDHPERREKIETIRMLFINMHHLINEFRPVQARDTLRHMMTKQNKEIVVSCLSV